MPGFILLQLNSHNWVSNRKMSESLIQGCALPPTGAFLLRHDIVNTDHSETGQTDRTWGDQGWPETNIHEVLVKSFAGENMPF